jgi:acyl dehydratase
MAQQLTVADYKARIGTELGHSDWIAITQPMIDQFADLTQDHQFIHVDPVKAADTPFGGTIAHGFLTLSMIPAGAYQVLPSVIGATHGVNYGCNRIRFMAPVRSGKRVRTHFSLKDLRDDKPGQILLTHEVTVEIEGEARPALVAEWLTMIFVADTAA